MYMYMYIYIYVQDLSTSTIVEAPYSLPISVNTYTYK